MGKVKAAALMSKSGLCAAQTTTVFLSMTSDHRTEIFALTGHESRELLARDYGKADKKSNNKNAAGIPRSAPQSASPRRHCCRQPDPHRLRPMIAIKLALTT